MTPSISNEETERLAALRRYGILDTPEEAAFDSVVQLACRQFGVPIALVSLIDEERQWFKAACGLDVRETPRKLAFCSYTILEDKVLTVPDARLDERFQDNLLVTGPPHIRFYAGAPLTTDSGHRIGTLCIIDTKPRHDFTEGETQLLRDLARVVVEQIEMRFASRRALQDNQDRVSAEAALDRSQRFTEAVLNHIQDGVVACDAEGRLSLFNLATRRFHGVDSEPIPPEQWAERFDLFEPDGKTPLAQDRIPLFRALRGERVEAQEIVIAPKDSPARTVLASGCQMHDPSGVLLGAVVSMHDISSERAADKKWKEANARYRAIFHETFQFCGLLEVDGTLIEVNQTALTFAGMPAENVRGVKFWDVAWWGTRTENRKDLIDAIRKAAAGEFVRYEVDIRSAEGREVPIDFSLKPVRDDTGKVVNLIAEGRDITEKRANEETLRRRTAELQLILDNVPIRIFYKDDKNRILRLNAPAAASMGMSVAEVEGRNTYDLFPETAAKYHRDDLEVINSGESKLGIVEQYTPAHGENGWVRTDKVPYFDPESGERTIFVAATDITTEKRAEEALLSSEVQYRQLYNKTPVMLQSIDAQGYLISVSDYWLQQLGYERDEVLGRAFTQFLSPASARQAIETDIPKLLEEGCCTAREYQIQTRSGDTLDILFSAVVEYDECGEVIDSLAVLSDVTERKAIERQLVQAQKMESVGQLTGGMAHDFNNLLGVVIGNLQLVERFLPNDEKTERRISAAIRAAEKGAELTRRLLAFSRRQKLETTTVDPNPLIEGIAKLLKHTIGEEISLECRLLDGLPSVNTDATQLESALINLALNARDAMPEGGALTVETSRVEIDASGTDTRHDVLPGEYVVLAVSDTGCGIPADQIERVFEPFFTTKEVGKGSGLGLSMIYGFMKQTGGHVRIYSEAGQGTTVRLYLPVAHASARSPAPSLELLATQLGGVETILIVEDQNEVRDVAVGLLSELGYKVIEARNGKEALSVLQTDADIDLLFTDIVMPGDVNGAELANAARTLRSDLPVVFTTGYAEAAVLRQGKIKLSDNLLTKPYRRDKLAEIIRNSLDRRTGQGLPALADASSSEVMS